MKPLPVGPGGAYGPAKKALELRPIGAGVFDEIRSADRFDSPDFSIRSERSKIQKISRFRVGSPPRDSLQVVGTRCTMFDRPSRSDIRRVAVWDSGLQRAYWPAFPEDCILFQNEYVDLMYRDITPEDYETLLKLDESIPKKTASSREVADLEIIDATTVIGETCGVCLVDFEDEDFVKRVPCPNGHLFHNDCISKWLLDCKNSCPVTHWCEVRKATILDLYDTVASIMNPRKMKIKTNEFRNSQRFTFCVDFATPLMLFWNAYLFLNTFCHSLFSSEYFCAGVF